MKKPYYSYIQIIRNLFNIKLAHVSNSGGVMKIFAMIISLVFMILGFYNPGMAQQKEKSAQPGAFEGLER